MSFTCKAWPFERAFKTAAFVAAAAVVAVLVQAPGGFSARAATAEEKEQIVLFYELQMAPEFCKWQNVGDSSKLDAKVEEAEKALGITEEEQTKFKAAAEADLHKPGTCDADGLARALYDEAVK